MQERLYRALKDQGIRTYVSVGHRLQLLQYHTHVLEFTSGGTGQWILHTAEQFERTMNARKELGI